MKKCGGGINAKIEVLRSSGVAYGPGFSRGVINIIAKTGQKEKPVAVNVSGSHGAWDSLNLSGNMGGRINQWDCYADLSCHETDGHEEEEEDRTSVLAKPGYNLSAQTRIGLRGNWMDKDRLSAYDLYKYSWQLENYRENIYFPRAADDDDLDLAETTYGLFWDNDLTFGDRWGLKIDLTFENQEPCRLENDDTMWGWSVAPSYHFSPYANLYVSASRNFWYPGPQDFSWASNYGGETNRPEGLKPETLTTCGAGYKHRLNQAFNLGLGVYRSDTKDKFASYYEDGDYMGQKNTGAAETYGVELEIEGRPLFSRKPICPLKHPIPVMTVPLS